MNLLLWFSSAILFIGTSSGVKVEPLSLPDGPYKCYLRCLAKCVETETILRKCSEQCDLYKNSTAPVCAQDDARCWSSCRNLTEAHPTDNLPNPVILYANYSVDPSPNPRLAVLEWTPVVGAKLYTIQYVEVDDKFITWATGGLGHVETISIRTTVPKKNLCPEYSFRVAAVNKYTVSEFSDVENLQRPIPYVPFPEAVIQERELIQKEYIDLTGAKIGNATVRTTVRYNPPPGWNLQSKDYVAQFGYSHLISCEKCDGSTPSFLLPSAQLDPDEPLAYFDFPDFVYSCECLFTAPLEWIKSKCNTMFNYEQPTAGQPYHPGLLFNFTCENTKNTKCYKPLTVTSPMCSVDNFDYETKPMNKSDKSEFKHVTIKWTPMKGSPKLPIESWSLHFVESEKSSAQTYPALTFMAIKDLGITKICDQRYNLSNCDAFVTNNGSLHINVDNLFKSGSYYVVQICALYNQSTESRINWNISARYTLDFTEEVSDKTGGQNSNESNTLTLGLSVGLAILFMIVATAITAYFMVNRKCIKTKSINELSLEEKREADDRYVAMPRRFDHWEIPRKRLKIYEDQKLGSGAFGSVFKGMVVGKLITHKDSMSVLAEHWMKTEDCEVAVKMLPEYADETSKSDFRKEINLMKQLGFHERLVNMLACITAEDPLCLVVEFCSEGDLLHYLRDRRKYMIKLEQANVDIHNVAEDGDVDYNLILCLKDLISFAWQISVGLEYLSQKGFIHRDVAARNVLVDKGKKAKIGDFGLCRFSYSDPIYMGKGGRLPIKWMALEAIKHYEFTNKSDVWSFGVLLFEIITLGGSPYPGIQPSDMEQLLESGQRMEQPDNCPNELYDIMISTWKAEQEKRPDFTVIRDQLRVMLEQITVDYSYLSLNQKRDYYNVIYGDETDRPNGSSGKKIAAFKNFNFTPDHEIELNSDNAISDNVFLHSDIPEDEQTETQKAQSHLPVTNLLHNAVHTDSISLTGESQLSPSSPTSYASTWRDSTSSDKALITPANKDTGKVKIFKFFKPTNLEDVPETATTSTDLV